MKAFFSNAAYHNAKSLLVWNFELNHKMICQSTPNCRNVVIEKQKPKTKYELIITDEYRSPKKTTDAVFGESSEMYE